MVLFVFPAFACETDEISYNSLCYKTFDIELTAGATSFSFYLTARGTFYVDWDPDNPNNNNSIQVVTRANALSSLNNSALVSSSSTYGLGSRIRIFGETPIEYSTSSTIPVISFSAGTGSVISGIAGSLGAVFPKISSGNDTKYIPSFYQTFKNCSNIESTIPEDLFLGVSGTRDRMFEETFIGCTKLSGNIPSNLFHASGSATSYLFRNTFNACSNLTGPVPDDLFSGVTGSMKSYMFYRTFYGCSKLGTDGNGNSIYFVSPTAFNYSGLSYNSMATSGIFTGTALLTACPAGAYTYHTGYEGAWVVSGSNKAVSCYLCPTGTYKQNADTTGVESTIDACLDCAAGTYNDLTGQASCALCPVDTYNANTGSNSVSACIACPVNATAPAGSTSSADCVTACNTFYQGVCAVACSDTDMNNLKTSTGLSIPIWGNKITTPSINIQHGNTTCYIPLVTGGTIPSNSLRINHNGTTYYVDSVN